MRSLRGNDETGWVSMVLAAYYTVLMTACVVIAGSLAASRIRLLRDRRTRP